MKLLTKELRDKLLANGREQAMVKGTKAERDFWPVVKFFYPAGAPTWLITEADPENPDVLFGLCRDQHKPHYVEHCIMLNSWEKAPCATSAPRNWLNITFMLPTSQNERSTGMSEQSDLEDAVHRIDGFANYLAEQGYAKGTIDHYRHCCHHFTRWLQQRRVALTAIDETIVEQFLDHDCRCPKVVIRRTKRGRAYVSRIRRFVRYLVTIGVLTGAASTACCETDHLRAFLDWMRRHRGTCEKTTLAHARTITGLLPQLGDDPGRYDAALINQVISKKLENISRVSAQQLCCSLRMYIRFLAATGRCSPALIGAIPRIPQWQLSALPRYILNDDVERVIASCDPTTAHGLRDRAVLLLLARLALRAGDVVNLQLHDIDWENALIRVAGKTRRTVALPLPQDAGDALLAYIEHARPVVDSTKIFIRVMAPFKPFASSTAVTIIVRNALDRAGVENANLRGAYLLRHSAATNMLRSGATLDAVGALLRHRSPETTAIYAKVDTSMLSQVVQPWIGGVPCR